MVDQFSTFGHQRGCILGDEDLNQTGIKTNPLRTKNDNSLTAFGELLVGQLHPIYQGSFEYTVDNTDLNTNTVVNGGTITQANAMMVISTSTTTASSALFQSKQHAKYRAGLGGVVRFTSLFSAPVAATEQYIGVMDRVGSSAAFMNGYAIGYTGTVFGLHRWQNDVLVTVAQSAWDDPLDGTGASGMTLDHTKLNVFFVQFEYLGGGAIKLWVENDSTGEKFIAHTILYANLNTEPSVHNPNFHHTAWVANKGTTSDIVLKGASYGYYVEGKTKFIELHQPTNGTGIKQKTSVGTTEISILTIRNKATYVSKTNFMDVVLKHISASIEASSPNNLGNVRLVRNAILGGTPSYSDINTTNSIIEFDVDGTTVTGGADLPVFPLAGKNDKVLEGLAGLEIILNPGDTITIAGSSAASATINADIAWRELF